MGTEFVMCDWGAVVRYVIGVALPTALSVTQSFPVAFVGQEAEVQSCSSDDDRAVARVAQVTFPQITAALGDITVVALDCPCAAPLVTLVVPADHV